MTEFFKLFEFFKNDALYFKQFKYKIKTITMIPNITNQINYKYSTDIEDIISKSKKNICKEILEKQDIYEEIEKTNVYESNYEKNMELFDEFLLDNLYHKNWNSFLKNLSLFKKKNHCEARKVDFVQSYKKLKLNEPDLYNILVKKGMRSNSGVLVVTVFTSAYPSYIDPDTNERKTQPFSCKHNCYFCPLEKASKDNNWVAQPRSYLYKEPGVLRANAANYDCFTQMNLRIVQYIDMGHTIDKLEILVLGGTFSEYPESYQIEFCRDIYYGANVALDTVKRKVRYSLKEEQNLNENAFVRIIGLTLETRPDCIDMNEIIKFRKFGCTRVQMGVQHTDDSILKKSNRGHTIQHSKNALKLLKDNGYKIDAHLMPNLLGTTPEKDELMLNTVLYDSNLQFDQLKIYPLQIVPFSVFETMFKNGKFVPYSDDLLKILLINFKNKVHPWIRLNRVIRDININDVLSGCKVPNMRQSIQSLANCRCIRCREVKDRTIGDMFLKIRYYYSSGGFEYFLSYESNDEKIIYGFLRLRIPDKKNINILPELIDSSLIRELHVYGAVSAVGSSSGKQHFGIGTKLLLKAEHISLANGFNKINIISGIGVRNFYKKRGYTLVTPNGFVQKNIITNYFLVLLYYFIHSIFVFTGLFHKKFLFYS